MENTSPLIILYLVNVLLFAISYLYGRRQLKKASSMWTPSFVVNLVFAFYLVFFYQKALLGKLGIETSLSYMGMIITTIGLICHHFSIMLKKKRSESRFLNLIHAQISHTAIFLPLGANLFSVNISLFRNLSGNLNLALTIVFALTSISLSVGGLLVGFKKIKLPY